MKETIKRFSKTPFYIICAYCGWLLRLGHCVISLIILGCLIWLCWSIKD